MITAMEFMESASGFVYVGMACILRSMTGCCCFLSDTDIAGILCALVSKLKRLHHNPFVTGGNAVRLIYLLAVEARYDN